MSPADEALIARVRACLDRGGPDDPAWRTLLGVIAIEITEAVPTAAVTVGDRSRLCINPRFVERHCANDAALAMLVRHEMLHVLLGHTRLHRRHDLASNWAFDALVNAQLARAYRDPVSLAFLRDVAAGPGLCRLLAPPPGWPGPAAQWGDDAIGRLHRRLYEAGDVTLAELHALLQDLARRTLEGLSEADRARLLGSHAADGAPAGTAGSPWDACWGQAAAALGVDRMDGLDRARAHAQARAAGLGGPRTTQRFAHARDRALAAAVRAALERCATESVRTLAPCLPVPVVAAVPCPDGRDRAAAVRAALGHPTLLWQSSTRHRAPGPRPACRVYLDVSGSMRDRLPVILDALAQAAPWVAWPLQAFSTEVVAVGAAALRAGRLDTTGGTAVGCVLAHRPRDDGNAATPRLVITDGELEPVDPACVRSARRVGLRGELLVVPRAAGSRATVAEGPAAAIAWAQALGWRLSVAQRGA